MKGGHYKPCSIDSTPAGRGSGPLRPISVMELQAEQPKGGGGGYKPCSIVSTPAERGSGPLRPISAMELQAEQVINAFRLLISLTEKE